jgi:hypothetical protein
MALAESVGDEPTISTIHSYYGYFAQAKNDRVTAEDHFVKSFEIRERLYGPDHALTIEALRLLNELKKDTDSTA